MKKARHRLTFPGAPRIQMDAQAGSSWAKALETQVPVAMRPNSPFTGASTSVVTGTAEFFLQAAFNWSADILPDLLSRTIS